MVSACISYSGKGRLQFVAERSTVTAAYYLKELLPSLIEDCRAVAGQDFIFQQDGAPAHTAECVQDFLRQTCPDFISKYDWPPNSPDLKPLDLNVWGVMVEQYARTIPKPFQSLRPCSKKYGKTFHSNRYRRPFYR